MKDDLKFKVRVSGIIINNGKLLVDKYDIDSYCLPGGYVEIGEETEKAIIRELYEETELYFDIVKFGGVIENFFVNFKNQKTHSIDFYYYVKLNDKSNYENLDMNYIESEKTGSIAHNYRWVNIKDIDSVNLLPSVIKNIIKEEKDSFHIVIND